MQKGWSSCRRRTRQDYQPPRTPPPLRRSCSTQRSPCRYELFELQRWLGHKWANSTQHYLDISPTKMAQSFRNAGYFARNVRAIDVLIDRDVVLNGKRGSGTLEILADLGHGFCTYDFFDQCPHRMACAKCSFYAAKGSSHAQLLEGKENLLRMRQDIPLSEAELAAVDDGTQAAARKTARSTGGHPYGPLDQPPAQLRASRTDADSRC